MKMRFSRQDYLMALMVLLASIAVLVSVRSPDYISDGLSRVQLVEKHSPKELQYGDFSHVLQTPLSSEIYTALRKQGFEISPAMPLLFLGMLGNALGALALGFGACILFGTRSVLIPGIILYLFSLIGAAYWNGENANLALGLACASVFAASIKNYRLTILFITLSILTRLDFILIAPAIGLVFFRDEPNGIARLRKLLRMGLLIAISVTILFFFIIVIIGKISSFKDLPGYFMEGSQIGGPSIVPFTLKNLVKAVKGSLSSVSIAAHVMGDLAQGHFREIVAARGLAVSLMYVFFSICILLGLALAGLSMLVHRRRNFIELLAFILVPLFVFNGRFLLQSEEYHAPSLVGWLLIFLGGIAAAERYLPFRKAIRSSVYVFLVIYAGFSVFGGLIPMRSYGMSRAALKNAIQKIGGSRQAMALVECDHELEDYVPSSRSIFRIIGEATNSSADDLDSTRRLSLDFIQNQLDSGDRVLISGDRCLATYMKEWYPKPRPVVIEASTMGLGYLADHYRFQPLGLPLLYHPWVNQTDPLSWHFSSIYELKTKSL